MAKKDYKKATDSKQKTVLHRHQHQQSHQHHFWQTASKNNSSPPPTPLSYNPASRMSHSIIAVICLSLVVYVTAMPAALQRVRRRETVLNHQWQQVHCQMNDVGLNAFEDRSLKASVANVTKLVDATCQLTAVYALLASQQNTSQDALNLDLKAYLSQLCQQVSSNIQSHIICMPAL